MNAYIQTVIRRYATRLQHDLRQGGLPRDVLIMQANGGIMSSEATCERSVATVLSDPAAGVIAAAAISHAAGLPNVMTCDMGGTSFDVACSSTARPWSPTSGLLDFRIPLRIPIINIHTIGADGGSIASCDEGGLLRVGPRSAGSTPGPISYGRGGTEPPVTDANVLLGRLSSEHLLAVDGPVDLDNVRGAFEALGRPLGLGPEQAASAMLQVVNRQNGRRDPAGELATGHDPRDFALFAAGGARPLHGVELARELGVPKVMIPYLPGITCALGRIVADVRHDFVRTISRLIEDGTRPATRDVLREQRAAGEARLQADKVPVKALQVTNEADTQYEGQTYTVRLGLDPEQLDVGSLRKELRSVCLRRFGIDLTSFHADIVNLRTGLVGIRERLDMRQMAQACIGGSATEAQIGERAVRFGQRRVLTPVLDRGALGPRTQFRGPAVLNQLDTTSVVMPGAQVSVDEFGNLLVELPS